jgi:hypothetical protein
MSYRKLFMLIAFAPLGLLLFVRDAQAWDEDTSPFGVLDWFDGSRVRCTLGFGETTIDDEEADHVIDARTIDTRTIETLTIRISSNRGKTITCAKIDEKNGTTQSGQAILVEPLEITGVQTGECKNLYGGRSGSEQSFVATCGKKNADVTATIQWVDGPLKGNKYKIGGSASLETDACKEFFPGVAPFDRNVIFVSTKFFNARGCKGEVNHGPTFFRGCSARNLNEPSACTDALHTGGTSSEGLRQLTEFGLTCRTPFNSNCKFNNSGVIQAEIDCTTIDCAQIIQSSLHCGDPDDPFKTLALDVHKSSDDPFKTLALDVHKSSGDIRVTCPRCFNSAPVFSAIGELVVAGQESDGTQFRQDIGGLCLGKLVPK